MKVTTERQENCIVQLTISVDEKTENEYMRRAARTLSRNYRMPGFRPGKAPYNVVLRRLGLETIQAQVIEQFGDSVFEQGLKDSGLEPIDKASLEDVTWEPFTLHLKVPVGPEVSLGNYRDIQIAWQEPQIGDEELEQELLRLQKEQSDWQSQERPAELGDRAIVDITSKVEDQVVLENTGREMVLNADSPYPIPGFAEAIVGMKAGETREFDLTYPEDHYNVEIAGKQGHFEVQLQEVRAEVLPALDDEFAMSVGDYDSLEDLKAKLQASLLEEAQTKAEDAYEDQIWEKLFEVATVEYPQLLVDQEMEALKSQFEGQLQQQRIDLETYLQLTNTTQEAWTEQMRPVAEERLKRNLVLGQVVQDEGLQVETEEVETEIEDMARPLGEQGDHVREAFASPMGKLRVTETLLLRKAMDRLKAIARGQEAAQEPQAEAAEDTAAQGEEGAAQQEEDRASEAESSETVAPEAEAVAGDAEPGDEATVEAAPAEAKPAQATPAQAAATEVQDADTPAEETQDPPEESG